MKSIRLLVLLLPALVLSAPVQVQAQPLRPDDAVFIEENFKTGYFFYNRRSYLAAIPYFEEAISLDPNDARARIWLGQSYFMAGYMQNALTEWQTVLNLGGGGNLLRNKIQSIYYMQGRELKTLDDIKPYLFLKSYEGYQNSKSHFVRPTGLAVSDNNRLYVVGFQSGSVAVLDPNGEVETTLSSRLSRPFDIAFSGDGSFYVSDFESDKIVHFNRSHSVIREFGTFGYRQGQMAGPQGIEIDRDGNVFVVDNGNDRVQKFSPEGEYLMSFGRGGSGDGEFLRPSGIVIDSSGRIFVSDYGNSRIQVFDPSGNFLYSFGDQQLSEPRGMYMVGDAMLVIADGTYGVVVYRFEDSSWHRLENMSGKISNALSVAADVNQMIYVADFNSFQVGLFVPEKLKYVNLDVQIMRTLETTFPTVHHAIFVRDRQNNPVRGLNRQNFKVYERGDQIASVTVTPPYNEKEGISFVYVVDKSEDMQKHQTSLSRVMRPMLEALPSRDRIAVINANEEQVWISQPFISNVLSPLNAVNQGAYSGRSSIGKALYLAISEVLSKEKMGAVVVFTTAQFIQEDYEPYDLATCLQYAKHNGVPVYLVLFDRGLDTERMTYFAEESGGSVFEALGSNELFGLRDMVVNQPPLYYLLSYSAFSHRALRGTYREFTVEVQYRDIFGYDKFGYYVPK